MIKALPTLFALLLTLNAFSQKQISGVIKDAFDSLPIPGVNIVAVGSNNSAITNIYGEFQIDASAPAKLRISHVGYQTIEMDIVNLNITVYLGELTGALSEVTVSGNRMEEKISKSPVTIEKLTGRDLLLAPSVDVFGALQNVKGIDLLTQSMSFKSVNLRGFGANNNNRFVQLTDGMDNRSPGLGFGFGNAAGISDLDVENIEILPGASSALYGPDALQGVMLINSKSPFLYQGLSAQVKFGANNFGKANGFGPKPYTDVALRYAQVFGYENRFAFKVNFERLDGTDFIADNYDDRSTRARAGFFATDSKNGGVATGLGYVTNNNPNSNLQYDGVNIYGDDINNGGAYTFPSPNIFGTSTPQPVTRTGYKEIDILGNDGKVTNTRANATLAYKLTDNIEANLGWYLGNGNFIRTAGFREYFPDYLRNQFKLEVKSDNFFVRGYITLQNAEAWNIGNTALIMNNTWKPLTQWANDFAAAYSNGSDIITSRAAADQGRLLPGSAGFIKLRDAISSTFNTDTIAGLVNTKGTRFKDNSSMTHFEGMYNFKNEFRFAEIVVGASLRNYYLNSRATLFPLKTDGSEYGIQEIGAYAQISKSIVFSEQVSFKPTAAIRYDKNEYFNGGVTPRYSAVLTIGNNNFRGSYQDAFRNPSASQLFAVPPVGKSGEVGGSLIAATASGLLSNPVYLENDVKDFQAGKITLDALKVKAYDPTKFSTEKIKTWEVGYKTLIDNKLSVDVFYYQSTYSDFIAAQNFYQLLTAGNSLDSLRNSGNYRSIQVNFNNYNQIFVKGAGIGIGYVFPGGYSAVFNGAYQLGTITLRDAQGNVINDRAGVPIVDREMSNPEVAQLGRNFFISPKYRFNISISNPKLTNNLGFNVTYRWTDKMWVEQGTTAGDIFLPSWQTLDLSVSYKIPKIKSIFKLGGTNVFNQYYQQGYGLANIGALYYVGWNFDPLFR